MPKYHFTIVLALGLIPIFAVADDKPLWAWHEKGAEIHTPVFSPKGDEVAIVCKKHEPDGAEAEEFSRSCLDRLDRRIQENERYADPEVVVLRIGTKSKTRVDWGWSPAFSPDGEQIAYAYQKKPISGFRILADTQEGNEIRLYSRKDNCVTTLAKPSSGYLSDPIFSPEGKHVAYFFAGAVNGSYGGPTGVGQVTIADKSSMTLYSPAKEFGLYHIIESKRYVGERLFAIRAKPEGTGTMIADFYHCELLELGPPLKERYIWSCSKSPRDLDLLVFCANPDGKLFVYDNGWHTPETRRAPGPNAGELPGIPSPDGRLVARSTATGIDIQDLQTEQKINSFTVDGKIAELTWAPDCRKLLTIVSKYRKSDDMIFLHDELRVLAL